MTPSRRQATAMIAGLVLVAGAVAVASYAVQPTKTQAFNLFYGSVFLNDERAPAAVDLTNAKPTVRLLDANTQVTAKKPSDLDVVPLVNGTLLLNTATGEFNMVDPSGFVTKTKNGGVPLPPHAGATSSVGIAADSSAYVLQTGPAGTSVYLVGQSTVQSATGTGAKVKPRAYATMTEPASTATGTAASANNDLWLLVGTGGSRTIRQLTLPRGSDAGVTLHSADRGSTAAVSAIGVTTGLSGGDVVAVAAPDRVQVFDGGATRSVAVHGLTGVDEILPATNQNSRLAFLFHSSTGWSLVSVPPGGGAGLGPVALPEIDPATRLAPPAQSNGRLFTMELGSTGRLWQIGAGGKAATPAGVAHYPVVKNSAGRALEVADFADAYALARGGRVVFNSPNHLNALALFTDGTHSPVRIDKSAAVSLNAAGGVTALTDPHTPRNPNQKAPPKTTTKVPPAQPISDKVACKTTTQVPHIPTITQATPGSRSVQLQWTYPLLDPRDCAPSTYTIAVKLISSAAPSPPSAVTVQGQTGVNLTGLFPDTRYQITVSAFLNGRGTPSAPVEVATGPEGPAAPTNVHSATDSAGNWTVTWNSCGGVAQGCVPSSSWSVIPNFCDGSGLSSTPATISIAGDPTQHSFLARFPGNDSILGRGLSFQVEGVGAKGTVGTPARDSACSYSWTPPVAGSISLQASSPPRTTSQATSSTTVTVHFAGSQTHDLGGVGGQLTYKLMSGGTVVAHSGPTTATTAKLDGIRPGQHYQVSVVVNPPRHPESSATIGPKDVTPAVAVWPTLSASATFANTDPLDGTLTVTITGLTSAQARGETFDLTGSNLICGGGNDVLPLDKADFDPAAPLTFTVDRTQFNGPCNVTVQLAQDARTITDPSVFGASASLAASSGPVPIDPPSLTSGAGDFQAAWTTDSTRANPQVVVSYHGTDPLLLASNWSLVVANPSGPCGSSSTQPPVTIRASASCVAAGGAFSVHITYDYFLSRPDFTITVTGTAPQPVDPAGFTFTADWGGSHANPTVNIHTTGDDATLASLQWTEIVSASTSPGVTCNPSSAALRTGTVTIGVSPTTCPAVGGQTPTTWALTISYHDPSGVSPDHTYPPLAITGVEP